MKRTLLALIALIIGCNQLAAQYNPLWIPDTLGGPTYRLVAKDTLTQVFPGQQTIVASYGRKSWGPTLMMRKGQQVQMEVTNRLNDSTTVHWHGLHLPAVMDGGPHQIIPPGTTWRPYWEVKNNAATYWYHPHMHEKSEVQLNMTLGGLIIIKDSVESRLPLPRKYGVDDFPIILADKRFDASNQIVRAAMGDTVFTNFTIKPSLDVPAQVVRFRVLNPGTDRTYNLAFSDNRQFYVITSDAGLLPSPVALRSYRLYPGSRIEILVDFGGQTGQAVAFMAKNTQLAIDDAGKEDQDSSSTLPFLRNYLGNKDFNLVRFNVVAATSNPITQIPATLVGPITDFPDTLQAVQRRYIPIGFMGRPCPPNNPFCFWVDSMFFNIRHINHTIGLNNTEIWTVENTTNFNHPFHVHDVSFKVLDIDGVAPTGVLAGWMDNLNLKGFGKIRIAAKFADYADTVHPFMYHCHIAGHSDGGMMGQFIVKQFLVSTPKVGVKPQPVLYPNPSEGRFYIKHPSADWKPYYLSIFDAVGRTMLMQPRPSMQDGIDVSNLKPGRYTVRILDEETKQASWHQLIVK